MFRLFDAAMIPWATDKKPARRTPFIYPERSALTLIAQTHPAAVPTCAGTRLPIAWPHCAPRGSRERPVGEQELFTLAVAIAVVVIIGRVVATWLDVPDAVVLVVLGILASLIPQIPNIELPPDLILLLFLPPLIYHAAFLSAPRETRENAVPITALGFGATAVTILGVGWVTTLLLPDIGWPVALAFAAAVAPTDAVAATSVLNRLGAPQRIVTIIEGESLINDGVALTAFGLAVEAMGHPFTVGHGLAGGRSGHRSRPALHP